MEIKAICLATLFVIPIACSTSMASVKGVDLEAIAPTIYSFRDFEETSNLLRKAGIIDIFSSDHRVRKTNLEPICTRSRRLNFAEYLESLARQTGTTPRYDAKHHRWDFEPPAMPLPYSLSVAAGWRAEDRGLYVAYIPTIAPVGMDIYMLGRFCNLSEEEFKEIRNDQALAFADKMRPGVSIDDMELRTINGHEALFFKTKAPIKGRQWRQWAFTIEDQAFLIVSAVDDENETKLIPDVESMVNSFQFVRTVNPIKSAKKSKP